MKYKDNIKYAHLQVEKDKNNIVYTVFDSYGALKTTQYRHELENYLYMFNIKIVDIIHMNYNCDYANIPAF